MSARQNYGFVVRWFVPDDALVTTVRARVEAGFPTQRDADLAMEEVCVALDAKEISIVECFVATFDWTGTVVQAVCEPE